MRTFQPNCTLPTTHGFVDNPNIRGTMEIVWESFGVIILCTWSILAVHVPEQFNEPVPGNSKFKSTLGRLGRACYPMLIKLGWMLFTLLLPEFVFGKALNGFMRAREVEKGKQPGVSEKAAVPALYQERMKGWTATHTMLADIGGFGIDFRSPPLPSRSEAGESLTADHGADVLVPSPGNNIEQRKDISAPEIQTRTDDTPEQAAMSRYSPLLPADAISIAACPEDLRLTKFIQEITHADSSLGGFDWQPNPDHRRIINELASEGHLPEEWSFEQFNEWARSPLYTLCGDKWILNAMQFLQAAERGLIALPTREVPESVIRDKSKSSGLVSLLALVQIVQLAASLVNRATHHIAISQLEMVALAYGVCGMVSTFWFLSLNRHYID